MDSAMDDKPPFGTFIPLSGSGTDVPSPKPLRFVFRDGHTYCIYPSVMSAHATDTNLAPAPADAPGHGDMTLDACDSVNLHPSIRTAPSQDRVTGDSQTNRRSDKDIKPIIPAANERSRASPSMRPIFRLSMLAEDASAAMETDGGGHVDPEAYSTASPELESLEVDMDAAGSSGDDGGDTTDDDNWHLEGLDALRKASRPTGAVNSESSPSEVASYPADSVVGTPMDQGYDDPGIVVRRQLSTASAPAMDPHDALVRASLPSPGNEAAMARFAAERVLTARRKQRQLAEAAARKAARHGTPGQSRAPTSVVPETDHIPLVFTSSHADRTESESRHDEASIQHQKKGSRMNRKQLKALADDGDQAALAELQDWRTHDRIVRERTRNSASNGDPDAIARLQKQRLAGKASRLKLQEKAAAGDAEAVAQIETRKEQSRANTASFRAKAKAKAAEGDSEAIARIRKQREQSKAWSIGQQQRAAAGDADAILALLKKADQTQEWQKNRRAKSSGGGEG